MIRQLNINDVERIAEIEQKEQITPLPFRTLYKWFSEGYFGWGLEDGNFLYGYTIASPIVNGTTHSVITCICKAYQNKKEGHALCHHALQEAKKLGVLEVIFEVRRSNVAELSMVKHFGAYIVDEKVGYYGGEDALIMKIDTGRLNDYV